MRKIKFRAWKHVNTPEMFNDVQVIDFKSGIAHLGYSLSNFTERTDKERLENLILMQYTGLKDKNGTEIYEGDALGKQGYWGYYVGQKDGAYVAYSAIPLDKVQRINWSWKNIKNCVDVGFVVIGNIYENPELLLEDK